MDSCVAVLGPSAAGKKCLARSLARMCTHSAADTGGDAVVGEEAAVPSPSNALLHLDTKYYSAKVVLTVHPSPSFSSPNASVVEDAEAVIVVQDCTQEPTSILASLAAWEPAFESCSGTMLLVLSKVDVSPAASSAACREACVEWALDHGFEVVEANCCDTVTGAAHPLTREKTGLHRVMEALESTMWSNMVRKPSLGMASASRTAAVAASPKLAHPHVVAGDATAAAAAGAGSDSSCAAAADGGYEPLADAGGAAGTASGPSLSLLTAASPAPVPVDQLLPLAPSHADADAWSDSLGVAGVDDVGVVPVSATATRGSGGSLPIPQEAVYERMLDGLDDIMQQIQVARTRSSGASDTDRRQNAAALAMRLAAMLGIEDDGDDDGESGST